MHRQDVARCFVVLRTDDRFLRTLESWGAFHLELLWGLRTKGPAEGSLVRGDQPLFPVLWESGSEHQCHVRRTGIQIQPWCSGGGA